jgi:hypothetical protein
MAEMLWALLFGVSSARETREWSDVQLDRLELIGAPSSITVEVTTGSCGNPE